MNKLQKPYTQTQKYNFIVENNHRLGMHIEETDTALYALKPYETLNGDEVISDIEAYEAEQATKEREYLDSLHVTRADMFEALLLAKNITKLQIREMIVANIADELQQALMLNRFDEALNFYRGYPVFDMLGAVVGISSMQWDNYFRKAIDEVTKTNAYLELMNENT